MKIKRFNNLWTMGLILCGVILGIIYFFKLFFPQTVIEIAQIDSITKIGHYIDNHKWAWYLASALLSFVSYYFICGGCCSKRVFNRKEILAILVTVIIVLLSNLIIPKYYTAINYVSLIALPYYLKGKFFNTTLIFSSLIILQVLTVEIRNIINLVANFNYATLIVLMIDYYIVEVLFYFAFNFKKGE